MTINIKPQWPSGIMCASSHNALEVLPLGLQNAENEALELVLIIQTDF